MSALMGLVFVMFARQQFLRDTPQVPRDAADRAAVMASTPLLFRTRAARTPVAPMVSVVLFNELRNHLVENQNLQAAARSRLDTDRCVATLDQALVREEIGEEYVREVLKKGLDEGQLQLIIDSAQRNKKHTLLKALGVGLETRAMSEELGHSVAQLIAYLTLSLSDPTRRGRIESDLDKLRDDLLSKSTRELPSRDMTKTGRDTKPGETDKGKTESLPAKGEKS
jgi:hypothetical protein